SALADTITLGALVEVVGFVDSNGTDIITGFTSTTDDLAFGGITDITGAAGAAVTSGAFTAVSTNTVDNDIQIISDGADALTAAGTEVILDYTNLTDVAAYLAEGFTSATDGDTVVFVINDLVGDKSYAYFYNEDVTNSTAVTAGDLALIGIITETNGVALVSGDSA
ncbi:MAG: hypothetical protein V7784_24110, partial [Oceanospirillaceae bacterium]